jgi:uncharacterized protein (UPF0276 family)
MKSKTKKWPLMGCGVGLRNDHYDHILKHQPEMDWFEAITENFMDSGGRPVAILEQIRKHYPVALHGVSLSVGSVDPLNEIYLHRLKLLVDRIQPFIVSDHLCWTGVEGEQLHDLLPLPFTQEAIKHIVARVHQVQEKIGRTILLENVSSYVTYKHSTIPEWEFITEVSRRSGCGILLDINNVYVNAKNHHFDPLEYLRYLPGEKIGQFHLAGHTDMGDFLFDTHKGQVIEAVWDLYREALNLWGPISTLIEWDEEIPEFSVLSAEAAKARAIYVTANPNQIPHEGKSRVLASVSDLNAPSLRDAQKQMKSYVLNQSDENSRSLLNPQGKATGAERMSIYAEGYGVRIHDGLLDTYKAIPHLIGKGRFQELAAEYTQYFHSQEYNLSAVGQSFPEFIPKSEVLKKFPFLFDLAKLELLISESFHAHEKAPFDPSTLQTLSPEDWEVLKLEFQDTVLAIRSEYPIFDLWTARNTPIKEIKIKLENHPQKVLISRSHFQVNCELLEPAKFYAIATLKEGKSLGEVCQELENFPEVDPSVITTWFSEWVQRGFLHQFKLGELKES